MLNLFVRSIVLYVIILFAIRFMGKRQVGEMQPFEFVITIIIADLATIPMSEISVPIIHGIVPIFSIIILHFVICFISRKSMRARYLISGRPAIVVTAKGINYQELKKLNMNLDDLIEMLRGCDVYNIEDVAYAIIETNGRLCTILKSGKMPVNRTDLNIDLTPSALPLNLVMDGKVMKENLNIARLEKDFIDDCIKQTNAKSFKEILLLTLDNNGVVFIQPKHAEARTFQSEFSGGEW